MRETARRRLVSVAVVGALLGALGAGCGAPTTEQAGEQTGDPTGSTGPSAPGEATTGGEAPPSDDTVDGGASPEDVAVQDASLDAAADRDGDQRAALPVEVVYDRLGWSMPIDPVGVAPDGQMEIPEDALRAGWYRFGPGAGAAEGSTVLAAHAGSYVTPRGPFWELTRARVGDRVEVTRADGRTVTYEVITVESIEKDVIDLRPFFDRAGDPRLVLITCGGVWDEERQSYGSNVVVTAVPVS